VLQEQRFERVGGNKTLQTDVRIIAATNRDLEKLVAAGEFREDLYYRLNGFTITLPPLRERGDDLYLLLEYFLKRFREELDKDVHGISPEALEVLRDYTWPGNVRELQSVLKQAILHAAGPLLVPDYLPQSVFETAAAANGSRRGEVSPGDLVPLVESRLRAGSSELYAETLEVMERYLLTRVLSATEGNQSRAAAILGITRGCLRSKIRALGIEINKSVAVKEADEDEAVQPV
jgi:transcriptional regulator with GAF, ATPase, and Fis domain